MDDQAPHPRAGCGGTSTSGARLDPMQQQVLDQVGEGLAIFDTDDHLRYVNPALAALHGRAVNELLGHHLSAFIDDAEQAARERAADEAQGRSLAHRQVSIRRLDGSRFDAEVTLSALRCGDGARAGTIVSEPGSDGDLQPTPPRG